MVTPHVHLYARHESQQRAGDLLGARLEGARDCDLVIDCAGTDAAVAQAVALCKPGATVLLLASYWGGLNLPATEVMMKEIRIVSSMAQARQGLARDVDIAAAAMAKNPAIAKLLITHRLPLEAAEEAFSIAGNRAAGAIKVTINP
jgi:threonine dehydrogenase-like Zn-dependent dehydrogenase